VTVISLGLGVAADGVEPRRTCRAGRNRERIVGILIVVLVVLAIIALIIFIARR
jgi:hypothetical protein